MRTLLFCLFPVLAASFSRLTTGFSPSSVKDVVIAGSTAPLPNFDPLQLSKIGDSRLAFFREAELKHGRLAMISALSIPLIEGFTGRPGVFEFQHLPADLQIGIVSLMFISEFSSMFYGWRNPLEAPFTLNEDYQPGDLGFNIYSDLYADQPNSMLNKELNNGRLAMIAALGMIAQELVTRHTLF